MNGRGTPLLKGFCTGIHSRTRGHYIIDEQNVPVVELPCPPMLKSTDHVTKPFFRCQICLRGGWAGSPEHAGPHRTAHAAAQFVRKHGGLVVATLSAADMVEGHRYD